MLYNVLHVILSQGEEHLDEVVTGHILLLRIRCWQVHFDLDIVLYLFEQLLSGELRKERANSILEVHFLQKFLLFTRNF